MSEDSSDWCFSSLDEVKENVFSTGYPKGKIHFIKGKVEDTIPTPGRVRNYFDSTREAMSLRLL